MVYGSGLENRQGASPRGFESHPLRSRLRFCKPSRANRARRYRHSGDSNKVRLVGRLSRKGSSEAVNPEPKRTPSASLFSFHSALASQCEIALDN